MAELCPFDQRRLPRELYVKFFVVHFIVIGAYSHLRHLRRERYNLHMYALVIACPLAGISLVAVPLLVLLLQAIITRCDWDAMYSSMEILLGQLPSDAEVKAIVREDARKTLDKMTKDFVDSYRKTFPSEALGITVEAMQKRIKRVFRDLGNYQAVDNDSTRVLVPDAPRSAPSLPCITDPDTYEMTALAEEGRANPTKNPPQVSTNNDSTSDSIKALRKFCLNFIVATKSFELYLELDNFALSAILRNLPLHSQPDEKDSRFLIVLFKEVSEVLEALESDTNADSAIIKARCREPLKITWESSRRLLWPLALLSQCITSVWLFHRRVTRGGDALYDHRILQLALLGLCVSMMTIFQLIFRPRFPLQADRADPRTGWVYLLRPDRRVDWLVFQHIISRERIERYTAHSGSLADGKAATALVLRLSESLREWIYLYGISAVTSSMGLMTHPPIAYLNEIFDRDSGPWPRTLLSLSFLSPHILALAILFVPSRGLWVKFWRANRFLCLCLILASFSMTTTIWLGPSPPYKWSFGLMDSFQQLWALFSIPPNAHEYLNATYTPDSYVFNGTSTHLNATFADADIFQATVASRSFTRLMLLSTILNTTYSWQADADSNSSNCPIPEEIADLTLVNATLSKYSTLDANAPIPNLVENLSMNLTLSFTPDWNRIWTFAHAPRAFPCPKAWKDPVADYVWWLA
ncbi:uncharacterized protein KY384_008555 [Bacidia gigantensis]|uniref:uncharacterized protein n=1 Tax=Bacidia gigantensis TaxID=2732470 RepID=UPI001D057E35|nr:uncharacterized protein KY384_008555 [Bacidia gigantensis]KAG8527126.1 hypothetical protein KY384_008555 [Bacidia gigantensis]